MRTAKLTLLLLTAIAFAYTPAATAAHSPRRVVFRNKAAAINRVPAPEEVIGFRPGDDRKLASWNKVIDYFRKLDAASSRVKFEELGKSTMGAPFVMATISAPENLARLEEYKKIQQQLADPRTLGPRSDSKALELVSRGKVIVLITCGIHSTEVGSYLSSMLIAHRLASSDEPLIRQILQNTIVLLVPSLNPDGVDIVKNWYDKTLGTPFEGTDPPELYHKYVGHDNNRDWYAFTQVETRITVDKIHNVWRPQIVHDIHQQGPNGSRLFLPPYMPPVEPNVPRQIIEGYTELGGAIASAMRATGFKGITTNTTYDAWTPARAYSHYHGGVRILSETASAKLATPVNIKFTELRSREGYNPQRESPEFSPIWPGGQWRLSNITDYMTTAAFLLLRHAAENRERWLNRFYEIGKEAVRARNERETAAFIIRRYRNRYAADNLANILRRGGVEIFESKGFTTSDGVKVNKDDYVILLSQPYGAFAKALLERQLYPNLLDENGQPQAPYDVTAHTLPLLMGVDVVEIKGRILANAKLVKARISETVSVVQLTLDKQSSLRSLRLGLYKSHVPSMDEGWTRYIFWGHGFNYASLEDRDIVRGNLRSAFDVIVLPDQPARAIFSGYAPDIMPPEFTGGLGPNGVKSLREFVEQGGTLICLNRASEFAIEQLKLPVRDITKGLKRTEFYVPGSILRIEMDTTHPIAPSKVESESVAWAENSPVFELSDPKEASRVRIVARYPQTKDALLSGWLLGGERLRGKAALVDVSVGRGRVILFGFRPQYRGQSLATYPIFFNALTLAAGKPAGGS